MSTTVDEVSDRIHEIWERKSALHDEVMQQMTVQFNAEHGSEEYLAAVRRIEAIDTERTALSEEQDMLLAERDRLWDERRLELQYSVEGFTRPAGLLANLLNRGLGALPRHALVIQPTKDTLRSVRSFWPLAVMTLVVAAVTLIALVTYVPYMGVSPYMLTYNGVRALTGSHVAASLASMAMLVLVIKKFGFAVKRIPNEGKFWDNFAMLEEQWFRMGAEAWTWKQRAYSCGAFGVMHVTNFIYPIASLLVVGLVLGGIAMFVYLREYRMSNDTTRATIAAAKFHATYNRLAVVYMIIALGLVLGYGLLP